MRSFMIGIMLLDTRELASSFSAMWGQARRQPSASQKEGFTRNWFCPHLDFELPSLQNYEKIKFCCWNHPVCGILLWHPEKIRTIHSPQLDYKIHKEPDFVCSLLYPRHLVATRHTVYLCSEMTEWMSCSMSSLECGRAGTNSDASW